MFDEFASEWLMEKAAVFVIILKNWYKYEMKEERTKCLHFRLGLGVRIMGKNIQNGDVKKDGSLSYVSRAKTAIKRIWEKNWEIPLFIIAVIAFLALLICFSAKKGFYMPVFGNDTSDTIAIADGNNCDAVFLRNGLDVLKAEFPKDTADTDACKEKYKKFGSILWIGKRYLGIGFFSYMFVIDTKYHAETRDCLKRVSVWKRTGMKNPRTEEELGDTAMRLMDK